jgi:vitamin B12 transporter
MKPVFISFLVFISAVPLFAQTQSVSEEIIVTASAVPETLDETPASVSVITRKDIDDRAARDVVDVLREVPGIAVARTGSPGKTTTLFLRGGSSKQALVLWNGIEMNNAYFSGYNFGQLSTAGVERVEIIRGPYSALYGSDAVSGVVNVLTVPSRSGLRVDAEAGQNGLRNGSFSGALVGGKWSAHAALERRDDDGFALNDDFGSDTVVIGVQMQAMPNLSVGLTARRNGYELGIPRNVNASATAFEPRLRRREEGSETQVVLPIRLDAGAMKYELRLSDNERTEDFNDPDSPFGGEFSTTDSSTRAARFTAQTAKSAFGVITIGGELERSYVDHTDSFGLDVRSRSRDSRSLFVEDRLSVKLRNATSIEVAAGARHDRFHTFGSHTSPRLAVAFVENNRKWRAAYGQGFRAPAIGELYAPFFGNAALDAERSQNVEAGFDQYAARGTFSLTLFRSDYDNLIAFEGSRFGNVDEARAEGVELAASRQFGPLDAGISYTRLRGVDIATDEQLIRRPKHSGSFSLGYDASPFIAQLVVTHSGSRRDLTDLFPFAPVTNRKYTVADITVRYALGALSPFVKVENATDEEYEEVFGYPSAARRVMAGVRYTLR